MKKHVLTLFFFLLTIIGFAQDIETEVMLRCPAGDLIHLRNKGYIISVSRASILKNLEYTEEIEQLDEVGLFLPAGDTVEMKAGIAFFKELFPNKPGYFPDLFHNSFLSGSVSVYSIEKQGYLSKIAISGVGKTDEFPSLRCSDPSTDETVFMYTTRTATRLKTIYQPGW